jgi:peptide/nickel transport system substrate-binding protein
MLIKHFKPFFICAALLVSLTACNGNADQASKESASSTDEKKATFVFNFPSNTLNPNVDENYTAIRAGVAETLVKIGEDLKIHPWLAKEWKTTDNGQTWVFTIKDHITFQNGKPLDAAAVKASLNKTIQESMAMKNTLNIESMDASGQTLTIKTKNPLPKFPSELVHPSTVILDVNEPNMSNKPIGTGPFKVDSFTKGTELKLTSYKNYWDGDVHLKHAVFAFNEDANARVAALQSGSADIIYRPPFESISTLKADSSIAINGVPSVRTHVMLYNATKPELKNENVRKAINALIDQEEVVKEIMDNQATVAKGPFLSKFPFSPEPSKAGKGVKAAKKYLEQAGYDIKGGKALKEGKPLSLSLVTYDSLPELPLIAQVIQSKAKELGITINIVLTDDSDHYLMEKNDWDLSIYSLLTAPRGDASYYLSTCYLPNGGLNASRINDKDLTETIQKLNSTVDENERNILAKQATAKINDEMLTSSIVHPKNVVAYKKYVKNWVTSPTEYYMLTKDLDIETK